MTAEVAESSFRIYGGTCGLKISQARDGGRSGDLVGNLHSS